MQTGSDLKQVMNLKINCELHWEAAQRGKNLRMWSYVSSSEHSVLDKLEVADGFLWRFSRQGITGIKSVDES